MIPNNEHSQPIVQNTLQFRITLLFIFLMIGMAFTILVIVQTVGKSLIIQENYRFLEQKGRTIVTQLGQQISYAEAKAKSLANLAETLPKDEALYKKAIAHLLYNKESDVNVAGGGIWPEPFTFNPKRKRRSFFWGHDADNNPVYFDDYNDPEGPGYHHEEWYVPARYLTSSDVYWSKSYVDPYSNEPMVTCTAPIFENRRFSGVSTIDLKLNDLKKFLDSEAEAVKGYIFAVDRNNTFLSFPELKYVKDLNFKAFINTKQLAAKKSQFLEINGALDAINQKVLKQKSNHKSFDDLANLIASESYQINIDEAKIIAAIFTRPEEKLIATDFIPISVSNDFLLNGPAVASIFLMPKTYWKIVIVSPRKQATGIADDISKQILLYLSFGVLLCVLIAYLYLRSVLVLPLKSMTQQLITTVENKNDLLMTLPETQKNELGNLAFWFNRRTEELNQEIESHKKSQEALKESEQQLSVHLQNTPVGAIWWDMEFKAMEWNPAAEKIFGYTKPEALGKHVTELILPEDVKEYVNDIFQDLLAGKGGDRSINENITKSGSRILCDWYNNLLKDVDGNIIGVASLVNDITETQQTENLKKTLFAISNAVNTTVNLEALYQQVHILLGDVIDVTNFFIAIVSQDKKTLDFPYFVDTVDDDFSPINDFSPDKSLTGYVVTKHKPLLLKEKELLELSKEERTLGPVPLIWMGAPLMIKDEVIGVIAVQSYTNPDIYTQFDLQVLTSISDQVAIAVDRKRTEDELRKSEQKYRHLFNNAPAGMYGIDFIKQRFTEVNDVLCKYTGYSEKELLSMNPLNLLTDESKEQFIEGYRKVIKGEKLSNQVEYNIIGKTGQELCVLLNSDFIYEGKRMVGARVVAHNITERKKIENMIIQSEKMMSVGGLAAGMAHEINNPLAGMMQNSQVILNRLTKDIPANKKAAEEIGTTMSIINSFMEKRGIIDQLESIHKAGVRAARIIENMLSFAKKSDSTKSTYKIEELINKTVHLAENDYDLKKKYDFKQVKIIRDYEPDVPAVLCEASKIQQVIFNIIKNASQAMHESGKKEPPTIVFRVKKILNMIRIEIEDNGPGIDFQTRKRIFEPFFTTKSVDKGTGLGLSVSYFIIVDDHKGKMEVDSVLGKGTTFIIHLPY